MKNKTDDKLKTLQRDFNKALDTYDAKVKPKSWFEKLTINLKGGVWVGLFTFLMLAGCIHTMFLDGKDIPEGVRWVYGIVLSAFAGTKITSKFVNGKNGQPVEED